MHTPPCILVVDDQPMNVEILASHLRQEGYEVLTATSGAEAISMVSDRQPDLILLDVIMPDLDGLEVCRRLKADSTLPFLPILMITAKVEPQDMVAGFEAGADDYLTKPLDQTVLAARVAAQLRYKARHDTVSDKGIQLEQQVVQRDDAAQELEDQIHDQLLDLERMGHLKRFLSPVIKGEGAVPLGDEEGWIGSEEEIIVVSCVLHGFDLFAERTEPKAVFEMLRDYHQVLGPLMNQFDGTLERFASAELQVMFNALTFNNPMEQAVQMALSIRHQLALQCERWRSSRCGLDVGIGVAHGKETLGLIELENRLSYAVIGSVRHLASRLGEEAQDGKVLISQSVWEEVEKRFHAEPAGKLVLNRYAEPIPFFEVKGEANDPL